jgi:hypothetical protein
MNTTHTATDVLSDIAQMPLDVQHIIHGFHRLNLVEDRARALHGNVVRVIDSLAHGYRWIVPFAEGVLAEGLTLIHEDEQIMADHGYPPVFTSAFADTSKDFPEYYDVDAFDTIACTQADLKLRMTQRVFTFPDVYRTLRRTGVNSPQ